MDVDEMDLAVRSRTAISLASTRCRDMPIRMELRPYVNRYCGDVQGIVLTDLYADRPGEGAGTQAMAALKGAADEMQVSVYTDAEGPRSHRFYLRHGFGPSQGRGHMLVYHPPLDIGDD